MNCNSVELTLELSRLLRQAGLMICTAESCTGGLIAKTLTDLAGSSVWFERGFVTYSNQSKMGMLGVQPASLDQFGAVSEAVAAEMVCGALNHSKAQVAIAVTGVAGPGGGSEVKPVGTVCFGFAVPAHRVTETQWFSGDRQQVRQASLGYALTRIIALLKAPV